MSFSKVIYFIYKRKNLVNVCFADRTFSSFDDLVSEYKFGFLIKYLFKFFFITVLTENFLESKGYKIISSDSEDDMIKDNASIKTGISNLVIKKFNQKNYFDEVNPKKNENIFLKLIFSKSEYLDFVISMDYVIEQIVFQSNSTRLETTENMNKSKNYDKLTEEYPNKEENTNENKDDYKILMYMKLFLEKFDSAGENILNMENLKSTAQREVFINVNFFE